MSGIIEQLDVAIANFLSTWNTSTTVLVGGLLVFLVWPIITGREPDIHPFLLARQSQASPVRQEGESAVYRANEIPYGYPLRKGLGVKDPGAPKWSAGRDGDLRDVWRAALRGPVDDSGTATGPRAKLLTIRGRDQPTQHELGEITKAINTIGKYVQENGGNTVAVCLSNSTELLATVFASAFYGFKLVLVPYGSAQGQLNSFLKDSSADFLIAEAGSIELSAITAAAPTIKQIIWVAQSGNRDLDWNEVPAGMGGKIELSTWHELLDERKSTASLEPPASEKESTPKSIAFFWPSSSGNYELFEFSSAHLVAGIGGLLSSVVRAQKLSHTDIVLPTAPLTESYTLCWVMAALFSNATVAFNSVAGDAIDLTLSASSLKPTVIITTSIAIQKHSDRMVSTIPSSPAALISNYFSKRAMQAGILTPSDKPGATGRNACFSNLRFLLISQRDTESTRVHSSTLSAIRLAFGVRIGYALTTGRVAGAVCQTNVLDYRDKGNAVNVGVPLASVEVWVKGPESAELTSDKPKGKITVAGPAVMGKQASLDIMAQVDSNHTFSLL